MHLHNSSFSHFFFEWWSIKLPWIMQWNAPNVLAQHFTLNNIFSCYLYAPAERKAQARSIDIPLKWLANNYDGLSSVQSELFFQAKISVGRERERAIQVWISTSAQWHSRCFRSYYHILRTRIRNEDASQLRRKAAKLWYQLIHKIHWFRYLSLGLKSHSAWLNKRPCCIPGTAP